MFVVESYAVAVFFCLITMLCWGSWGNTQKLAGKTWRYELYYWDYVFGVVITALIFGLTLGDNGGAGRSFLTDLDQADMNSLLSAFLGGVVFNAANILLVAAIAIAGLSVAFPVGIGLALVLGVLINYFFISSAGNPVLLFGGVALVTLAVILNAVAYKMLPQQMDGNETAEKKPGVAKGIMLAVLCGILMSLFYFLVARSIASVEVIETGTSEVIAGPPATGATTGESVYFLRPINAESLAKGTLEAGKMTPYSANFIFTLGVLASSFIFVTMFMKHPVSGEPVPASAYLQGTFRDHLWGLIGGGIWAVGMTLNVLASSVASPAISYGLGQGATMVAAIWGVFVWREFKNGNKTTSILLKAMFAAFFVGLGMIIWARS